MTDNYREWASWCFCFRGKRASEHRLHAEDLKEIAGDDTTLNSLGLADTSQVHIGIEERAELFEDLIVRSPVEKVTYRGFVSIPHLRPQLLIRFPHHH